MTSSFISEWAKAQVPRATSLKDTSVFYRNLEKELDIRRAQHNCISLHIDECAVDFASHDSLALGASGAIRKGYLEELSKIPDFSLSARGSRLANGNSKYLEDLEREIAEFHGAPSALIIGSGHLGNDAIFSVIPQPGDAIVYDELIHASVHDGMKHSLALVRRSFEHNSVESLIDVLTDIRDTQPMISNGSRSVLVSVESIYSMDGDVCLLEEIIEAAKEVLPKGNVQFIIDEAHATGIIGPRGAGLVCALGLEKEMAIRLHTFSKAASAAGAVILCNETVRTMLINYSRSIMFSGAPTSTFMAAIRAGYQLMISGATQKAQERVPEIIGMFVEELTTSPIWDEAYDADLVRLPLYETGEPRTFISQVLPIWTPQFKHNFYLALHLQQAGFSVFPVSFPVVPKGKERVRIVFHAFNTDEQVRDLVAAILAWAQEMLDIKKSNNPKRLPMAGRRFYALIEEASLANATKAISINGEHK